MVIALGNDRCGQSDLDVFAADRSELSFGRIGEYFPFGEKNQRLGVFEHGIGKRA